MSKRTVQELHADICDALGDLSELFVPGMKLTFIARFPGNGEADVLVSDDKMPEIIALVERRIKAESTS
jgi:hypothetical protein